MKTKTVLLIVTLLAGTVLLNSQAARRRPAGASSQEIGKAIEQLEAQLRIASLKGDAAWFEQHLAEGYTEIDGQGKITGRAEVIRALRNSEVAYDTINLSEGSARIFNGDTVLIIQKEEIAGGVNGKNFSGVFRCSRLWIKQNGEWQLAATQLSPNPG